MVILKNITKSKRNSGMKYLVFLLCMLSVICSTYSGSLAADKVLKCVACDDGLGHALDNNFAAP